jgi:hypothetical protein
MNPNTTTTTTQHPEGNAARTQQIAQRVRSLIQDEKLTPEHIERELNSYKQTGSTQYKEVEQLGLMNCEWPELRQIIEHFGKTETAAAGNTRVA